MIYNFEIFELPYYYAFIHTRQIAIFSSYLLDVRRSLYYLTYLNIFLNIINSYLQNYNDNIIELIIFIKMHKL
jgi:hypothetical protein